MISFYQVNLKSAPKSEKAPVISVRLPQIYYSHCGKFHISTLVDVSLAVTWNAGSEFFITGEPKYAIIDGLLSMNRCLLNYLLNLSTLKET